MNNNNNNNNNNSNNSNNNDEFNQIDVFRFHVSFVVKIEPVWAGRLGVFSWKQGGKKRERRRCIIFKMGFE